MNEIVDAIQTLTLVISIAGLAIVVAIMANKWR